MWDAPMLRKRTTQKAGQVYRCTCLSQLRHGLPLKKKRGQGNQLLYYFKSFDAPVGIQGVTFENRISLLINDANH
jgi:hypothetical protein